MEHRGQENLTSLLETLEDLLTQARAYEKVLPPHNFAAHSAVYALRELAERAQNEAISLKETLSPQPTEKNNLTPRETEILKLVAKGLANKEIAYQLAISERTVQFHLKSIFTKTDTSSRTEAVTKALKKGWAIL